MSDRVSVLDPTRERRPLRIPKPPLEFKSYGQPTGPGDVRNLTFPQKQIFRWTHIVNVSFFGGP